MARAGRDPRRLVVTVFVGLVGGAALLGVCAYGLSRVIWRGTAEHVWGSYTTSLAARTPEELANIAAGCAALDRREIAPGGQLSFNQIVGQRVLEAGYQPATALMGEQADQIVGGGICQLSSTLYNAALLAGLTIAERHPHTQPVASVPPGLDATVMYGSRDLRLVNPWEAPLVLRTRAEGLSLRVSFVARTACPFRGSVERQSRALRTGYEVSVDRKLTFADGQVRQEFVSRDRYLAGGG
jgi:vancomycin resistance protein YoaR